MPERITLLDIAKANGSDAVVGLIDETSKAHPEITLGDARTISGINYETLVRTELPGGGSFREVNDGIEVSKAKHANRLVSTYVLDRRWEADKAAADRYEDGAEAYIALEAEAQMEKAMQDLAAQFYYGNAGAYAANALGFPGLMQSYDASNMVVDAGGTTDDVASSVWLLRFGAQHVRWVWGRNGLLQASDVRVETITTGSKKFDAYVQNMLAYPGIQVGSVRSTVRIKKLTTDSGKGLTDDLIYEALAKFPVGTTPDVILMTRRSAEQLRRSRTATNATGAPAPMPQSFPGLAGESIQIAITDSIRNNEKLAW